MKILQLDDQDGWRGGEQHVSHLVMLTPTFGHETSLSGRPNTPFTRADFEGAETTGHLLYIATSLYGLRKGRAKAESD